MFFSGLGGLIVLVWFLAQISNDFDEQFTSAANRQQRDYSGQQGGRVFHWVGRLLGLYSEPECSISDQSEQDQKRKLDADMVLWTRFVARYTKALVFVGVVGLIIAAGTLWAIKGQLDVMENDKRPWLNADISINKRIEITEWGTSRGIRVPLKLAMKNYGQVPAVNIRISVSAWPHPGTIKRAEILSLQKKACDQAIEVSDNDPTGGIALFPSESTIADAEANISGNALYKDGTPTLWAIFGCVDYTYGDRKHGQTGFNYLLGKNIDGQVFGVPFVEGKYGGGASSDEQIKAGFPKENPKWAEVPIGDVWFMAADSGNYAK